MNHERLAMFAAAGTGFQVGAAMVATRFVVDEVSPTTLALLRYVIGSMFLLIPLVMLRRMPRFARGDLVPIALLGIGQFAVLVVLINVGLAWIQAARAAVIFASMPLITMLLGAALGLERLTAAKTAGVILTMLGVALAFGDKLLAGGGSGEWVGALAVLGSAFTGAVCSVYYRPYLRRYPTLEVSAFAMMASVAALLIASLLEAGLAVVPTISMKGWIAVVFIGFSSGVGYVLWLWALTHASPTRVTVMLSLSPVTAALLGALILGESPGLTIVLGIVAVAAGLYLANRDPR
jgi:drug/metabolite transporter (DMT)-like permease